MKKIILPLAITLLSLYSCGNSGKDEKGDSTKKDSATAETAKPKFEDLCKDPSSLTLTIKDFKAGLSGKYEYPSGSFDVKQSSFTMENDSVAHIKLSNYAQADLVGDRKDTQVDIMLDLRTKHGKKIGPGVYMHDSEKDMSCFATMMTSKGTVYFNWVMGMPDIGTVTINFADDGKACGAFSLASENPKNDMIGTVRLNGNFVVGK